MAYDYGLVAARLGAWWLFLKTYTFIINNLSTITYEKL